MTRPPGARSAQILHTGPSPGGPRARTPTRSDTATRRTSLIDRHGLTVGYVRPCNRPLRRSSTARLTPLSVAERASALGHAARMRPSLQPLAIPEAGLPKPRALKTQAIQEQVACVPDSAIRGDPREPRKIGGNGKMGGIRGYGGEGNGGNGASKRGRLGKRWCTPRKMRIKWRKMEGTCTELSEYHRLYGSRFPHFFAEGLTGNWRSGTIGGKAGHPEVPQNHVPWGLARA